MEKGNVCGTLSRDGFWLHCVVGWQVIAFLKNQLRRFWILNQLHFRCRESVYGLISTIEGEGDRVLEKERVGLQTPTLFLGEWEFEKAAISDCAGGSKRSAFPFRSMPKVFAAAAGNFKVSLALSNNSDMDRLQLSWEVEFGVEFDETNAEDVQLNLEISGAACSRSHEAIPSIASWPQTARSWPVDDFARDSSFGKQLLSGLPLVCCLRIALSVMKESCVVQPLH
jgi:hypothetical protein